jgi:hypothetical protein
MVAFSPNDLSFLVSAVDNDVKQYQTCDARLSVEFQIPPLNHASNYTRTYYGNGGDVVVSGGSAHDSLYMCDVASGQLIETIKVYEGMCVRTPRLYLRFLVSCPFPHNSVWDDVVWVVGRSKPDLFIQSLRCSPTRDNRFAVLVYNRNSDLPCALPLLCHALPRLFALFCSVQAPELWAVGCLFDARR